MNGISFAKKLITCVIAGMVIGASALRIGVTYFGNWGAITAFSIIPFIIIAASVVYAVIWQARKKNNPSPLAFWQGLIRYGIAFDLAEFGWAKIFHLQLVMPASKLDMPYNSFSPSDLFWNFFSYSYTFGCIIAALQIAGALLLLFHRTRLLGAFILLPVLANILLMDIFYQIGSSVVVHASIMMAGILYCLLTEFNRLKTFFLAAINPLPSFPFPKFGKLIVRLSVIYIPLLLITLHGKADKHPALNGKYQVKQISINRQLLHHDPCADSTLTTVYFDIKNGCVFQFNSPLNRWNGNYFPDSNRFSIKWFLPAGKQIFNGTIAGPDGSGKIILSGMMGKDSMNIIMQKIYN